MRIKILFVTLLLVTNIIWGYLFYNAQKDKEEIKHVEIYTLAGNNVHWQVSNYQIIVTPEKIERGHAEFIYLGDTKEIEQSDYYSISFYEGKPTGEQEVVYRNVSSSIGGSVNLIENVKNSGSISGPYSHDERLKTKSDYANSFAEIIWNDSEGVEHKESIDLVITNHFNLEEFIQ